MTSEVRCQRRDCGRINPAVDSFCYYCGAPLGEWEKTGSETGTSAPASAVRATLKLPDNREIPLAMRAQWIGRDDFNGIVSENSVTYISQRHLIIRFENGLYYVEDQDSTNGTRLNGAEIKGKGKFRLNNSDLIEVAEVITLIFRVA